MQIRQNSCAEPARALNHAQAPTEARASTRPGARIDQFEPADVAHRSACQARRATATQRAQELCCPISFDLLEAGVRLPCGHAFNEDSIKPVTTSTKLCPCCRLPFATAPVVDNGLRAASADFTKWFPEGVVDATDECVERYLRAHKGDKKTVGQFAPPPQLPLSHNPWGGVDTRDWRERLRAVQQSWHAGLNARPLLVLAASDPDSDVRQAAYEGIRRIGLAIHQVASLLQSPRWETRLAATRACAALGSEGRAALTLACADLDGDVRGEAYAIVRRTGLNAAQLAELAASPRWATRLTAMEICPLAGVQARPVVVRGASDSDADVRNAAYVAIRALGLTLDQLAELLQSPRWSTRLLAVNKAVHFGQNGRPLLVAATWDRDNDVRNAACAGIAALGLTLAQVETLLGNPDWQVRLQAVHACRPWGVAAVRLREMALKDRDKDVRAAAQRL